MLISVVCPGCGETYKVHETLRGKSMRCLRTTCRRVFTIDDRPAKETRSAPSTQVQHPRTSGSVGDVIPLEEVEAVEEVEAAPVAKHVHDVLEMLPADSAIEARSLPLEAVNPDSAIPPPGPHETLRTRRPRKAQVPEAPRVQGYNEAAPPPVRRRPADAAQPPPAIDELETVGSPEPEALEEVSAVPTETEVDPAHEDDLIVRPRTRWAKWVVAALLLVTFGGLSGGGYVLYKQLILNEEERASKADGLYDQGQFLQAAQAYELLARRFSNSEHVERYRFRKDLSELRKQLAEPSDDLEDELVHADQFLDERAQDPLLPPDASALGNDLVRVLVGFAERSLKDLKDEAPLKTVDSAAKVVKQFKAIKLPKDGKRPAWEKVDDAFRNLRDSIALMKERKQRLDELRALAGEPTYPGIVALENRLKEIEPRFPDLPGSPEVRGLIERQRAEHKENVRYVPVQGTRGKVPPDDHEPAILLDPQLGEGQAPAQGDTVGLALARGVLTAVSRKTGDVLWARRVGIDTTTLPVRVPARAGIAERLLVLSSDDPPALTALDLAGNTLWRHEFKPDSPVLGRPVVVDQRAFLATLKGEVQEIELIEGKLIGRYDLGQRLTLGGTLEPSPDPETKRVYFPGDDGCVYILDVAKRKCEGVLYTRHPAGSLRGEPIVVPPHGEDGPGFLILNQADGLDGIRLRVFDLPVRSSQASERPLKTPATLEGWTWFDPYHDPEKLILLSDAGRMGLFGIQQAHNRDQALFHLLPGDSLDLGPMLFPTPAQVARARGRSEIVQAQGDDLWVLASGRLQRLRLAWSNAVGPKLVPVWRDALEVGSPIHASQSLEDFGKTSLLTVTQPPRRSCVWVSHLDDDKGRVFWRRQLGLVCQGEPVQLPLNGGPPIWLACDQAGALFALDPTQLQPMKHSPKLFRIPNVLLAGSLDENPDQPPLLLVAEDRQSAYAVACPGTGRELIVRHVKPGPGGRQLDVNESKIELQERLQGKPVLVGPHLMLPLAEGVLARRPLDALNGLPETGPEWRIDRLQPADARCHVVGLGGSRFLTTGGNRGLYVREWQPAATVWSELPEGRGDGPTYEMPDRVTGLALLPGETPRVAVTDASRTLTLLEVTDKGALVKKQEWKLNGQVTTGPFVYKMKGGTRLACVVNRSRLTWIDPAAKEPAWTYPAPGDNTIVGEPQLVDETTLAVADGAGRYVRIDCRSGKPLGAGYQIKGSIAPTSAPVPFAKDRLLAPLSDGTLMLLGVEKLGGK